MRYCFTLLLFIIAYTLQAQEIAPPTFKDTRVINSHSVETLKNRKLDIRIGHRFGDLFGDFGGWPTFYGLENAADVMIGAEYGISNVLTIGISRTKGAGPLKQLINPSLKYKVLRQNEENMPFTLTALAMGSISTMSTNPNPEALSNFKTFSHRMVYNVQLILGRRFSDRFSMQISPGVIHRNQVRFGETNDLLFLNAAARIQLSRVIGLILDGTLPVSNTLESSGDPYYLPFGIGFEFDTGGHVFQVNFTNARGMMETDYIPYSTSNWANGGFRLGFTISRLFNL